MDHGLRDLINEPDSIGNTPLHALIVRLEDRLQTLMQLMDHGLRDLINEPDSLKNTPLHAIIVR
jgi:hypothetical protein